ncbi:MAG: ABC transporter substrate-binding protein [Bacteroidaceae bacterium]|nr:ABC transporter substrate-binding protein [Bacteroidaceae bacterium]
MRKLLCFLAILGMVGMAGSCYQPSQEDHDVDSTTLQLGVLPTVDCLPFYYADSMGLFKSEGLDVRLITFEAVMDADTAFMNGWIDGIVSDMVKACIWRENGDSIYTSMVGDLRLWLITAAKARLLKTENIKEKIIGMTRHSAADYFADKLLTSVKLQSIDLNKPQINNIRLRTLMVDQDQYDGAILPEPYASEAVARGAKRLDGTSDMKLEGLLCVLWGNSISQNRREDIEKIRKVYDQAVTRLNADTLSNVLEYLPKTHRMYLPDTLYSYAPLSPSLQFNDSMMNDVKEWAKGRGLIKKDKSSNRK